MEHLYTSNVVMLDKIHKPQYTVCTYINRKTLSPAPKDHWCVDFEFMKMTCKRGKKETFAQLALNVNM